MAIANKGVRKVRPTHPGEMLREDFLPDYGLLILAGLVETKTGQPTRDRGELLGALVALVHTPATATQRAAWKRTGDALLQAPRRYSLL